MLDSEAHARQRENAFQRRRRRNRSIQVKLGHGGTLDPLATGVLIVGVGRGTKHLQQFLECTKSYDATVLIGASTDTYDITGKVIGTSPALGVSKDKVEAVLERFRGDFLQRPPLFSALRMEGKRLYEYAREGKEPPAEIQQRPVSVKELFVREWLPAGSHRFELNPSAAETEVVKRAQGALDLPKLDVRRTSTPIDNPKAQNAVEQGDSGVQVVPEQDETAATTSSFKVCSTQEGPAVQQAESLEGPSNNNPPSAMLGSSNLDRLLPTPAINLRMTVSSGFYVRSLCHDLGKAVGSMGVMAALTRVRQGQFELGKNVLTYDDLCKDEETWGPKLCAMLDDWKQSVNSEKRDSTATAKQTVSGESPASLSKGRSLPSGSPEK